MSTDSTTFITSTDEIPAPKRLIPLEVIAEIVRSGLELEAMTGDEIKIMLRRYSLDRNDKNRPSDRKNEIKITPEMIEAGISALGEHLYECSLNFVPQPEFRPDLVCAVYEAMWRNT